MHYLSTRQGVARCELLFTADAQYAYMMKTTALSKPDKLDIFMKITHL